MTQRMAAVCAAVLVAVPAFAQTPATMPASAQTPALVTAPACASCTGQPDPDPAPSGACDLCATCPAPAVWLSAEYLFAWIPGDHVPQLITTSPAGTPRAQAGVLGQPGTQTLFGGNDLNGGLRSGLRFQGGYWFDDDHKFGIEAGTMLLESQSTGAAFSSTGNPILARPIFNVSTSLPDSVLAAYPGVASGPVAAQVHSGNFYEGHFDFAQNCYEKGWFRLDALLGYRFFTFDEGLGVQQVSFPVGTGIITGTKITSYDSFGTSNEFNGGDFGFRARFRRGTLSADFVTRLAVGILDRGVNINGQTLTAVPGSAATLQTGGLLALTSNIGNYSPHYATLLPEFGLNLGWQVLPYLKLRAGYNLMLLDRIARAADQVDLAVNPALIPNIVQTLAPPLRPEFQLCTSEIWLQALSLGVEFTF